MPWTLHVEPTPGVSTAEEGRSADALKDRARDIWRADHLSAKVDFTILDPAGRPWSACTRYRGGSWRASWKDVEGDNLESRARRDRAQAQEFEEQAERLSAQAKELRERARILRQTHISRCVWTQGVDAKPLRVEWK